MSADFKVPFGLSSNNELISPEEARKSEDYFCPSCRTKLSFRCGSVKKPHFAHLPSFSCSRESVLHFAAKLAIKEAVDTCIQRKGQIEMLITCAQCQNCFPLPFPAQQAHAAELEHKLPSDRVADVAVLFEQRPVLDVEIYVTHAVDVEKSQDLTVCWVELAAEEVLNNPYLWKPRQCRLNTVRCKPCRDRNKAQKKRSAEKAKQDKLKAKKTEALIQTLAQKWSLKWADSYTPKVAVCWNCKDTILTFTCSVREHPKPRPKTLSCWVVKTSKDKHARNYGQTVNTCPACGVDQSGPTPKKRKKRSRFTFREEPRELTREEKEQCWQHIIGNGNW